MAHQLIKAIIREVRGHQIKRLVIVALVVWVLVHVSVVQEVVDGQFLVFVADQIGLNALLFAESKGLELISLRSQLQLRLLH